MRIRNDVEASQLFRQTPQRLLDVGPGAVAYRKVGQGPDVLFVHGWPVTSATWRRLLPHLTPHVTCHLIDLVGAGDSQFSRDTRIDLKLHVESVRRVLDVLALSSVAAVGHDSGGLIARHALAGDARLRSMGLVNTEQPQGLTWRFRQFLWMAKLPGFASLLSWAAMKPTLRRNPYLLGDCFHDRARLDGEFEEFFLSPLREDSERRWAAGVLGRTFDPAYVHALADVHARIHVPVQLVWGEGDPFFPVARAKAMCATFSNGSLEVISNAKLFVHEERPEAVAKALLPALLGKQRINGQRTHAG
ncbi:MAG: alpha/beta hydrolase [Myxococcota bacterium]